MFRPDSRAGLRRRPRRRGHRAAPRVACLACALALLALPAVARATHALEADRVVVVLIDGLRYSEGLGDPDSIFAPKMARLASMGAKIEPFLNDGRTITRHAIPAAWMGGWFGSRDTVYAGTATQYSRAPTFFEAYRKQLARPAEDCVYFIKDVGNPWRQSFDPAYGPDFWPMVHMAGATDLEVWSQFLFIVPALEPRLIFLYLADVDHAGHIGIWDDYLQAIRTADDILWELHQFLESHPFYAGRTNVFVTNDHGRHDNSNGGFAHHGDGCAGCRNIMLLAWGPDVPDGIVGTTARALPDIAPTVGHVLGFETPWATGEVMRELFVRPAPPVEPFVPLTGTLHLSPNPLRGAQTIEWEVSRPGRVFVEVFDTAGRKRRSITVQQTTVGRGRLQWNGADDRGEALPAGIYHVRVRHGALQMTARTAIVR